MPEIPKKKVPEGKRPIPPRKVEEAPPPKGIVSPSFQETIFRIVCSQANTNCVSVLFAMSVFVNFVCYECIVGVYLCFVLGLRETTLRF